jgi:NhaP-type Na+/H+ or K+/H+ antiporter
MSYLESIQKVILEIGPFALAGLAVGLLLEYIIKWWRRNKTEEEVRITKQKEHHYLAWFVIILTFIGVPLILNFDGEESSIISAYVGVCCGFFLTIAGLSAIKEWRNQIGLELLVEGEEE